MVAMTSPRSSAGISRRAGREPPPALLNIAVLVPPCNSGDVDIGVDQIFFEHLVNLDPIWAV
jgi:hypothetical protein